MPLRDAGYRRKTPDAAKGRFVQVPPSDTIQIAFPLVMHGFQPCTSAPIGVPGAECRIPRRPPAATCSHGRRGISIGRLCPGLRRKWGSEASSAVVGQWFRATRTRCREYAVGLISPNAAHFAGSATQVSEYRLSSGVEALTPPSSSAAIARERTWTLRTCRCRAQTAQK
jgi:hypothetical protein